MAEVSVKIKGLKKVNESLDRLKRFLKKPEPFYKNASTLMKKDVLQHFLDEKGDDNVRWDKSERAKREHGKTLRDDGILILSIQKAFSSSGSAVGTNLDYAPQHNLGLGVMPERRFLWLSKSAGEKINSIMLRHIAGALK